MDVAPACDPALAPFLHASDVEAARDALGVLLDTRAKPLLAAIARRQLGGAALQEGQDVEDVVAGALLRLSEHLWSARQTGSAPIESFPAYVAATAHNACHAFLRRRHPERARVRSRLRYLLTHDPALALWDEGAEATCGLAAWRGRPPAREASQRLLDLRGRVAPFTTPGSLAPPALAFARLVRDLVARAAGPCRLADLASLLDDVLGVTATASQPIEGSGEAGGALPIAAPGPGPDEALEQRDHLERLWSEIRLLPVRQRAALLLNLRDREGRGMIGLLPLVGLATRQEIAAALEMPHPELEAIWEDLPRDDAWIAERLRVTRRQVINFRKCARERLARRMREPRGALADEVERA